MLYIFFFFFFVNWQWTYNFKFSEPITASVRIVKSEYIYANCVWLRNFINTVRYQVGSLPYDFFVTSEASRPWKVNTVSPFDQHKTGASESHVFPLVTRHCDLLLELTQKSTMWVHLTCYTRSSESNLWPTYNSTMWFNFWTTGNSTKWFQLTNLYFFLNATAQDKSYTNERYIVI